MCGVHGHSCSQHGTFPSSVVFLLVWKGAQDCAKGKERVISPMLKPVLCFIVIIMRFLIPRSTLLHS